MEEEVVEVLEGAGGEVMEEDFTPNEHPPSPKPKVTISDANTRK